VSPELLLSSPTDNWPNQQKTTFVDTFVPEKTRKQVSSVTDIWMVPGLLQIVSCLSQSDMPEKNV
jgi:hypothetical protein